MLKQKNNARTTIQKFSGIIWNVFRIRVTPATYMYETITALYYNLHINDILIPQ